jgi:hypothetical protein
MTGYPEVGTAKPALVAGAEKCNSTFVWWHNLFVADVNIDGSAVLRLRICGHAACRALFTICVSCDRGRRYCRPECRLEVRRQRHDANCRYQQSELGRDSHRRCRQRYRERASQPEVTDQGIVPITSPAPPQRATVCQCAICGRHSLWIDPFPPSHDDSGRPPFEKMRFPTIASTENGGRDFSQRFRISA